MLIEELQSEGSKRPVLIFGANHLANDLKIMLKQEVYDIQTDE